MSFISWLREFICGNCDKRADDLEKENRALEKENAQMREQRRHYVSYIVIFFAVAITFSIVHKVFG